MYVRQQWELRTSEKWVSLPGCLNIAKFKHSDTEGSHCVHLAWLLLQQNLQKLGKKFQRTVQNLALNKHIPVRL